MSGVETQHVRLLDKDNNAVIDLWLTQKYPADLWTRAFRGRNLGLEMSDDERAKAMKKYGVKPGFSMKMRVEQAGGCACGVPGRGNQAGAGCHPPSSLFPRATRRIQGPAGKQP